MNEITAPRPLLDDRGHITEEGWARQPFWKYERKKIKAPWFRIKEWDYYYVISQRHGIGVTMTMSDLGYAGLMALCWLDFNSGTYYQTDTLAALSRGKLGFSGDPDNQIIEFSDNKLSLRFEAAGGKRTLVFSAPELDINGSKGMEGRIELAQPPELESMNIATSWAEKRTAFYYNRKINCMPASGIVKAGGRSYDFSPETETGTIDWGRGVWTYKNRWYWSSCSGFLDNEPFGFNLGYGFSDRTPASENMLFYKGLAHKLDEVTFHFRPENYMLPWQVTSSDGRLELEFVPTMDRVSKFNMLAIKSDQHQVFGRFSGKAVLDDGTVLNLDGFPGFAEDVYNQW